MQPPIPLESVLQNRYRIIQVLGQGGFGRTYLAQDQGRFNELCALKELIPNQNDDFHLEKSKELFQREAATLYQIQHPQVPQFRANFEEDQRLFLVQDYVEGKTYHELLEERKTQGQTFSETAVLQLIRQLLPVLAHLHTRGIIHRDISPDNIILRESDNKPVLIDFGVVKELATQFQSANHSPQPTTVGKLGYAPSEQLQTGKAYPNSDLYALAVTAIVLLTGKEPQELFDDTELTWNWQQWATISPEFAEVLHRMLSMRPGDRYQSVVEVAKALSSVDRLNVPNPQLPSWQRGAIANPKSSTPPALTPEVSRIQTIAVSRPNVINSNRSSSHSDPVIPLPQKREIWENPWAVIGIGICVALVAGFGSLFLVSYFLSTRTPEPQSFPSPVVPESPTPTPTVTPTPSPEPTTFSQQLDLVPGATASVSGTLQANGTANYTFNGEQGQQISINLAQEGVLLTVLGPNQAPIEELARRVTRYQGTLPFTGEYTIQLSPVQGIEESNYQLDVLLETPLPTPTPTETTPSTVVPTIVPERINVIPGEVVTSSGVTGPQQRTRYLVNVQQGQVLSVAVAQGAVTLDLLDPDGQPIEGATNLLNWQSQVLRSGDYQIDVIPTTNEDIEFTVNIGIENLQ